jgi:hypothetical protein
LSSKQDRVFLLCVLPGDVRTTSEINRKAVTS